MTTTEAHRPTSATASTPPRSSPPSTPSKRRPRGGQVPVPGPQRVGRAAPTAAARSATSSGSARSARTSALRRSTPTTPPCSWARTTADAGRVRAARPGRLPDRRPGQHRRRPGRHADRGALHRRGRHRPQRDPGPRPRGAQRLPGIAVRFAVKGDAPADVLRRIVEQSPAASAVFDVLTNGVPVAISVDAA